MDEVQFELETPIVGDDFLFLNVGDGASITIKVTNAEGTFEQKVSATDFIELEKDGQPYMLQAGDFLEVIVSEDGKTPNSIFVEL